MQLKEWRIYLIGAELFPIDGKEHYDLTNEEFMSIAEENDGVRTLQGYANDFNSNEVSTEDFMRIIAVPVNDESYANASKPEDLDSYLETYFEIVQEIVLTIEKEKEGEGNAITRQHDEKGRGGLYELAKEWTDEFEAKYKGIEWGVEIEFHEKLEEFLDLKTIGEKYSYNVTYFDEYSEQVETTQIDEYNEELAWDLFKEFGHTKKRGYYLEMERVINID